MDAFQIVISIMMGMGAALVAILWTVFFQKMEKLERRIERLEEWPLDPMS